MHRYNSQRQYGKLFGQFCNSCELISVAEEALSELTVVLLSAFDACESDDVLLSHDVKHETISAAAIVTAKMNMREYLTIYL